MTESIGGRIEIIGHAIATIGKAMEAADVALSRDQSQLGREVHRKAMTDLIKQIMLLSAMQIELAAKFDAESTQ